MFRAGNCGRVVSDLVAAAGPVPAEEERDDVLRTEPPGRLVSEEDVSILQKRATAE